MRVLSAKEVDAVSGGTFFFGFFKFYSFSLFSWFGFGARSCAPAVAAAPVQLR